MPLATLLRVETAAQVATGLVLVWAAGSKLRVRRDLPDIVGAYGVPAPSRAPLAAALVAAEAVLGVLLLARVAPELAAAGALALAGVFVAAPLAARLRGIRRIRCGCFGVRERATSLVLARALGFAALAALAVFGGRLDAAAPSRETLVLVALGVLACAVVVLGVLVLALYRQVGVLSLRLGPRAALEVPEEGPPLETPAPALTGLERRGAELVAFVSEGCRLCRELTPSFRALAREGLAVRIVSEEEEGAAFRRWNVPGSPFVVHVVDGVVAAKGLVNTLEQLDGLIAAGTARRRNAAA